MQARYYDPVIGRFYSNDPIGFRDVHSFNRYAYANNNPYKYVDPDGKENEYAALTLVVAAAGTDYASPEPTDANPVKAGAYASAIVGTAIGGTIVLVYNKLTEEDKEKNNQYSKGGKQRTKDTGLAGYSDDEIKDLYNESKGKDRKRYEKELKSREQKNKDKNRKNKRQPPKKHKEKE
ncbi:RHS repeat-associated core domain-containing protein [Neptunicella sp.]|uniref:RHS repeat-associated core domain-containing protein n=1 Tax=Neptunicella sp. TaxID=2125986 RepID=UPI003F690665